MNNLRAEVEIAETGERVFIEGDSVQEMIAQIQKAVGDYVHVTIRTLAVLGVVLSVVSYPSYAADMACVDGICYQSGSIDDISTAGQIHAPACSGVDCIQEVK